MERKRDFSWLRNWRILTLCGGCIVAGFLLGMLIFGAPWHLPPAWGDIPTWITAIATAGLLVGAIVTAIYAIRAFREQSREVHGQAEMLRIQSEQLTEQRKINEKQMKVLDLQANELKESFKERKWEAEQRRTAQAAKVFVSQVNSVYAPDDPSEISETFDETDAWTDITRAEAESQGGWEVAEMTIVNTSEQPAYAARLCWYRDSAGHGQPNPEPIETIMPGVRIKIIRRFPLGTNMAVCGAILLFRDAAGTTWIRRPDGSLVEQSSPDPPPR